MSDERGIGQQGRVQGFTLVEVLVVSVIVGILAAVAIPLYTGYIQGQRRQAALAVAQTAAITASSLSRRNQAVPDDGQLNAAISLPNPTQFNIHVNTVSGVNYVVVTELSRPSDPIKDSASFK